MTKVETNSEKQAERSLELTPEERQATEQISALLKEHNINAATELIRKLISTSQNGEVVRQYARLLERITQPAKKPQAQEEQAFQIKVEKPIVTFKNVIGMNKLKKQLSKEMILMLKNRQGYIKHHLKPSGLLLYGPPGTGKTFLSEALAGQFNASIIKPDLATLFSQWVGETEKNIKKMVMLATQNEPCVIFIDEVDAKMRNRANIEARGESAVNLGATTQFLETMQDVHTENNQVFFVAATNRVWDVDSAAKRPGRLGDQVYVPPPSLKDRFILFVHFLKTVENRRISPFGYLRLSLATARYSPADIEEICIKAKKDMLYENYNKQDKAYSRKLTRKEYLDYNIKGLLPDKPNAYYEKKFTRDEYLESKEKGRVPQKPREALSTQKVINTIIKDFKTSSLDAWYVESKKALIGWEEDVVEKQKGLIMSKTLKKRVKHEGSITKDEQKIYKPMIKDIKRANSNRWYTLIIRHIARLG